MLYLSLEEVVGKDLSHLTKEESTFDHHGLSIHCWKFTNENLRHLNYPTSIVIHGGPGFTHNYMLPLVLLADAGYPVIFYDQGGCGDSTFLNNVEQVKPELLTLDYYVDELKALIAYHNLTYYYLYGSSWGTIVAQEFAVLQPGGLLGMVLDGALHDAQHYIQTQWRDRISTLPTVTQKLLKELTESGQFDHPRYKVLEEVLSSFFTTRLIPSAQCYIDSCDKSNREIYVKMQGASEFTVGGVLERWSIVDRLHSVICPTLILVGEYDTMTMELSQSIQQHIPTAWPVIEIPRAGHCKLLDEPQLCVNETIRFIKTIEATRKLAIIDVIDKITL